MKDEENYIGDILVYPVAYELIPAGDEGEEEGEGDDGLVGTRPDDR